MLSSYSKKIIGIHANSAGEFEKVLTHLFNKKDISFIEKTCNCTKKWKLICKRFAKSQTLIKKDRLSLILAPILRKTRISIMSYKYSIVYTMENLRDRVDVKLQLILKNFSGLYLD